ncbi:zinc finger domain-containing protein [Tubulinosema ratisbonensis]|uniref:mRNA 3'-end-processing protein n=1 Tax=Tubulinosema ratisbonensis TaxID=291195 RepID=A0A437AIM4_9MICR|nr:zinc finger domain-containing protein [Tubulinosema ratisbonensis]
MEKEEPIFDFEEFVHKTLGLKEIEQYYCPDYQQNRCFNKSCQLQHIKLDKAVICKHWLRGLCKKRTGCEFLHEYNLKKMPECWFFSKFGECTNRDCLFLHVDPESVYRECLWYKRGFCRHGNMCRNKHIKKKLCYNYYLGFCPAGPNCEFGHPKNEIPDTDLQRTYKRQDVIERPSNIIRD